MDKRQRTILRLAGYVLFFIVFFLVMCWVLFPFNRWKGTLEETLSRQLDRRVTIGAVSSWGLTGLKLHDVEIAPQEQGQKDEVAGQREPASKSGAKKKKKSKKKEPPLKVDRLGLRYSLMAAVTGKMGLCFDVRVFDGTIKGCYVDGARSPIGSPKELDPTKDGPSSSLRMKIRGLDMNRVDKLDSLVGLPFFGEVDADVDLEYAAGRPDTVGGQVEVRVESLRIGEPDGKIDLSKAGGGVIAGEITFIPIEVGDLTMTLTGKEGKLVVERFESKSDHMQIRGGGDISMREPILQSGLNIYVMFKFLPGYIDKSSMNKTIFSALDRIPQLRKAKRPDGFFGFLLKGDLRSGPKPLPSRSGPSRDDDLAGPGKKKPGGKPVLPMGIKSKKPNVIGGKPAVDMSNQ